LKVSWITTSDSVENAYLLHSDVILQIQARWITLCSIIDCPCTIYLYESHLYIYLPTRTSRPHSYESVLYISVPATCNSTCTKHKSDICRLVRVRLTDTSLLFCAFAVPATCKSTDSYQKTNLKFMYVCLFVISLWCSKKHGQHTNHHSADNPPYLLFRKKSSSCYFQKAGCRMCCCHDRRPQG
jgi:hypothetical protein